MVDLVTVRALSVEGFTDQDVSEGSAGAFGRVGQGQLPVALTVVLALGNNVAGFPVPDTTKVRRLVSWEGRNELPAFSSDRNLGIEKRKVERLTGPDERGGAELDWLGFHVFGSFCQALKAAPPLAT